LLADFWMLQPGKPSSSSSSAGAPGTRHTTAPFFPHRDLAAHSTTSSRHSFGMGRRFAFFATQLGGAVLHTHLRRQAKKSCRKSAEQSGISQVSAPPSTPPPQLDAARTAHPVAQRAAALSADAEDDAVCESFFATLECEPLDRQRFGTQAAAQLAVFEYIEGWHNIKLGERLEWSNPVDGCVQDR
jgi:putative transposase